MISIASISFLDGFRLVPYKDTIGMRVALSTSSGTCAPLLALPRKPCSGPNTFYNIYPKSFEAVYQVRFTNNGSLITQYANPFSFKVKQVFICLIRPVLISSLGEKETGALDSKCGKEEGSLKAP